jgi:pimeloyl-ACP methyl ester carboxylesterase
VKTIDFNNSTVCYDERGSEQAPAVIFIHAFPLSHQMWKSQLQAASSNYRAIAYDVRGIGGSSLGTATPSMELFTNDLFHLMDALQVKTATLVGLSMGGYIALRAKEKSPDRISAMVLADTRTEPDSPEGREKRFATCKNLEAGGASAFQEFVERFLTGAVDKNTPTEQPVVMEKLRTIILANPIAGICAALRAMADRTDTSAALTHHPLPTLFLVGEGDTITPVENSREMQKKHGNAELHILPKAGHLSNCENPEAFNHHLLSFLQRGR